MDITVNNEEQKYHFQFESFIINLQGSKLLKVKIPSRDNNHLERPHFLSEKYFLFMREAQGEKRGINIKIYEVQVVSDKIIPRLIREFEGSNYLWADWDSQYESLFVIEKNRVPSINEHKPGRSGKSCTFRIIFLNTKELEESEYPLRIDLVDYKFPNLFTKGIDFRARSNFSRYFQVIRLEDVHPFFYNFLIFFCGKWKFIWGFQDVLFNCNFIFNFIFFILYFF